MATYTFELYDLDGIALGEVMNATNREINLAINAVETCTFEISLQNPRAKTILAPYNDFLGPGDVILAVFEDNDCIFCGELSNASVSGSAGSISCTFSSALWKLNHRIAHPMDGKGVYNPTGPAPREQIIHSLLAEENTTMIDTGSGAQVRHTGIARGVFDSLATVQYDTTGKTVAEVIADLAPGYTFNFVKPDPVDALDGNPTHGSSSGNMVVGVLRYLEPPNSQEWVGPNAADPHGTTGYFKPAAGDFQAYTGHPSPPGYFQHIGRDETDDGGGGFWANYGRYMIVDGLTFDGLVQVGVDVRMQPTWGQVRILGGVVARFKDWDNCVYAVLHYHGAEYPGNDGVDDPGPFQFFIHVWKRRNGVGKEVGITKIPNPGTLSHPMALQLKADGSGIVFWDTIGSAPDAVTYSPEQILSWEADPEMADDDLYLGGPGGVGVYDCCQAPGGTPVYAWHQDESAPGIAGLTGGRGWRGQDGWYRTSAGGASAWEAGHYRWGLYPPFTQFVNVPAPSYPVWNDSNDAMDFVAVNPYPGAAASDGYWYEYPGAGVREQLIFRNEGGSLGPPGNNQSFRTTWVNRQLLVIDHYNPAAAQPRRYDNFYAGTPTQEPFGLPFDFEIVPQAPTPDVDGNLIIGVLNVKQRLGYIRTSEIADIEPVVLSYPENVTAFTQSIDRDTLANRVYSLPDVVSEDTGSVEKRGLYEAVITDGADQVSGVRQGYANLHKTVRRYPRQIITIEETTPDAPQLKRGGGVNTYWLGDTILFRAIVGGQVRIGPEEVGDLDRAFRVYGATIKIDDLGVATAVPKLTVS